MSSGQIADWHDPRTSKMNKEINYQSRNIRIRYIESSRHAIYIYGEGRYILFKVFGSLVPGYYHLKADPSIVFFDGEVSISIGGRGGISFQSILDLQRVCIIHNGERGEGDLLFKANPDADLILRQFVRDNSIVESGVSLNA